MRYPLAAPMAAVAAGIFAAQYVTFSFRELSTSILLLLALALAGLLRGALRAGAAACLLGFSGVGALLASLPHPADRTRIDLVAEREHLDLRDPIRLAGWVRVPPTVRRDRHQFVLAVESIGAGTAASGGVRVTILRRTGEAEPELHYGDHLEFLARLRHIRNFKNAGSFDRAAALLRQDIEMTASVRAGVPLRKIEGRRGRPFPALIWRAREWVERRLDRLLGPESRSGGIVKAMLLGDEAYIDPALSLAFQRTGTYHALVVAGLHVGALACLFLFLFRSLRISGGWSAVATAAPLAGFVLLCGSRLPTVRAACMVTGYLIARAFYRHRRALNILAGTALGFLIVDPADLFDVSFQLSFLSVGAIAAIAVPVIERFLDPYRLALVDLPDRSRDLHLPPKVGQIRIEWRAIAARLPFAQRNSSKILCCLIRPPLALAELAIVSACVQIGLALPMAAWFHRVSWSGIAANVFVVPLISLIVPIGFLTVGTGWPLLAHLLSSLVTAMAGIVGWHARWVWLEARVPDPPPWLAALLGAALVIFAWFLEKQRPARGAGARNIPSEPPAWSVRAGLVSAGFALAMALFALVSYPFPARVDRGKLELTALDVGQGEALFLSLPQNQTMLVDAGGLAAFGSTAIPMPDVGEEVVSSYLWARSIRALDVVVISHAHYDHIGGLPAVLENFRVKELWIGNNPPSPEYDHLLDLARRRGARISHLTRGETRCLGGVTFEVLGPAPDYAPRSRPSNDDSLVLLTRFGERSFLLTGDIERGSERRLISDGFLCHADVLKVPHHGSKTSTSERFLDEVRPWFGVVSAGADNPYGHPHADVLARLAAYRTRLFRTDQEGAVTLKTDGHRLYVSTYAWEQRSGWIRELR